MNLTEKLYESDAFLTSMPAKVLACEPYKTGYAIVLNRTVFYPEGGGQPCDKGKLDGQDVTFVFIRDGIVYHVVPQPIEVGKTVFGVIDWARRFDFMQQHSGEHIATGLAFRIFGANNVGFHLTETSVVLDVDKELGAKEIAQIEDAANRAIYENVPVYAGYPTDEELEKLAFRSKLERIHGDEIRIVEVPNCDVCACCGTHVAFTGQVGVVKILDYQKHRQGTRITMAAGRRAIKDYAEHQTQVNQISALLSAKPELVAGAVQRVLNEQEEMRSEMSALKNEWIALKLRDVPIGKKYTFYNEPNLKPDVLRRMVLALMERSEGICAVFSLDEAGAFKYAVGSNTEDMRAFGKEMNAVLRGKGGGGKELIQGSVTVRLEEIEGFFG